MVLRGVSFGNEVWSNVRLPRRHHDEADYQRVAAMGMNAVRFYMNYKTFEADAAPGKYLDDGWQWLDDNIAWARRHGVYLILNMHVPPGGFQSLGAGKALWDRPEMQDRLIALWTAIARHCKGEPTIAGYDLLNEPVVTARRASGATWRRASRPRIRTVDADHMLFVERLNSVAGDWSEDAERGFFRIPDPNTVYEFHFYKPFHFTHQSASWVPFTAENVRYPDTRAEVEWFLLDRKAGTEASPKLPPGDSPWTFYPGAPFKIDDPAIVVGKPVLVVKQADAGQGLVRRSDAGGAGRRRQGQARDLGEEPDRHARLVLLDQGRGKGGAVRSENGHGDGASIVAAGTVGDANLGADVLRFRTAPGATYRLSGWMRGEKIPPQATCQIRLDFFTSRAKVQDERSRVHGAGDRRLRRLGQAREGAAVPGRDRRHPLRLRRGSRRAALGVGHARHRARAQAVVHVPRVPRGRLRDLPRLGQPPRSRARQHARSSSCSPSKLRRRSSARVGASVYIFWKTRT